LTTNFTKIKKTKMQEKPLHIKKFFIWLSYSIVGFFVFGFLFSCAPTKNTPKAVNGVLDIRDWDFKQDGILKLDGEWKFYWGKFCKEDLETGNSIPFDSCPKESSVFENVPGVWDEYAKDSPNPEKGYGTYHLKILSNTEQTFSVKVNTINSVRDVYVNGKLVSSSGTLSREESEIIPKLETEILSPNEKIEDITIFVSNYFEATGGMVQSPEIGSKYSLEYFHRRNQAIDLLIFSALFVIGFYHLGLFIQRKESMYIYYGLTCINLGIRQPIVGSNTIYYFFPDFSWYLGIKLANLSFYFTILLFTRYILSFYNIKGGIIYKFYQLVFILLSLILYFTSIKQLNELTKFSTYLVPVVLIHIIYIIFSNKNEAHGRSFFYLFLIFSLFIMNDLLFFLGIIQSAYMTSLGFLIFFLGQANLLSSLFSKAFSDAKEAKRIAEEQKSLLILSNHELELTKERATKAYLDLEASQKQLVQSDKMITLGTMVAGVAHEINTPLGAIKANSENILEALRSLLHKLNPNLSLITVEDLKNILSVLELAKESSALSSREARALRKKIISMLEMNNHKNVEFVADYILELNLYESLESGEEILNHPEIEKYLSIAGDLYGIRKKSSVIQTSAERVSKIVKSLKSFMHFDQDEVKVVSDLTEGMETVLIILHNKIKYGIEVIKNYGENVPQILCYPDELNQIWTNLIHNAIQAMDEKGTLQIDIESVTKLEGTPDIDKRNPDYKSGYVSVSIQDSGSGISPEIRAKIFQAFFTTKPAGEGSGLGLHIIGKILEKHGGALYLESEPGKTRFTVILPIESYPN
jgi:signal transduction histidine kinase